MEEVECLFFCTMRLKVLFLLESGREREERMLAKGLGAAQKPNTKGKKAKVRAEETERKLSTFSLLLSPRGKLIAFVNIF